MEGYADTTGGGMTVYVVFPFILLIVLCRGCVVCIVLCRAINLP
jgi:hypothetical protein